MSPPEPLLSIRDLSVSFENIGNVQMAQGDLAGALKSYGDSLAMINRLAKSDPSNSGWQRDLAIAYGKIGDAQSAQGSLADALATYRDGLAVMEKLVKADPNTRGLAKP